MPTSEARIQANRKNAAKSTGPKTEEGKERSRQNSLKHGLTGAGVVLPEADAAEVARRAVAFAEELLAEGEVGLALARRAALNSVRMERGADQQAAALADRIYRVAADFVPPEGVDADEADRLRTEACRRAMFDPSPEANLARKYEAAAERGFYRALKELNRMDRQAEALLKADQAANVNALMGSILASQKKYDRIDAEFAALYPEMAAPIPSRPTNFTQTARTTAEVDVPITIGRGR